MRTAATLYEPFRHIKWPRKLLLMGSGVTLPPPTWKGVPSLRVNDRTLGNTSYPVHTVITNWRKRITMRHDATVRAAIGICFDSRKTPGESITRGPRRIIVGTKDIHDIYPYSELPLGSVPSTGLHVVLWLLCADVDQIYIAGFDGHMNADFYKGYDKKTYARRETHDIHNFGAEWSIIMKCVEEARTRSIEVHAQGEHADAES